MSSSVISDTNLSFPISPLEAKSALVSLRGITYRPSCDGYDLGRQTTSLSYVVFFLDLGADWLRLRLSINIEGKRVEGCLEY